MESLGRGVETSIDDKEEKKPSNEGDEAQSVCCLSIPHCDQFVNKNRPAYLAPRAVKKNPKKEVFTVYLKSRRLPTEVDEATKEFMKQKLELELRVRYPMSKVIAHH